MAASPETLTRLRHRIAAIEGICGGRRTATSRPLEFGLAAIDRHLPDLPDAGLHEIIDRGCYGNRGGHDGAATAFAAALLGRQQRRTGRPVFWIARHESLCSHGLAAYGLASADLVLVHATQAVDALWAMEEALRESAVGAVLGEIDALDLTASRRLQLAAEAGGTMAVLLRPDVAARSQPTVAATAAPRQTPGNPPSARPSACVTRWRVGAAASGPARPAHVVGPARWQIELLRCRGGTPRQWLVEWNDATGGFTVAAPLPDRPAVPAAGGTGAAQWSKVRRLAG